MNRYDIRTYAVIGAGNMGSGIAQKIATEGLPVVLVDLDDEKVARGLGIIRKMVDQGVERKVFRPERAEKILGNISGTSDWSKLAEVDMVIEAVFEDLEVKRRVFRRLGEVCKRDAILGTNTSSFLVKDVAEVTLHPERVIGLHFFYHPAKNRLVEVIGHEDSDPDAFDAAWAAMEATGKTPIRSADAPGFVVNRYFVPWVNEAVRLLGEGVADLPTIEAAAKQAFGVGMGPFELMNVTGVPISLHAANSLGKSLHPFYAAGEALVEHVESGKGNWSLEGEADASKFQVVADRLLGVTFYVAAQLVHEGVSTVEDVDIGARVGLRWPHGPFQMINKIGVERAAELASAIADKWHLDVPFLIANPGDRKIRINLVQFEEKGGLAVIRFNRPDALNALNVQVGVQLLQAIERARVTGLPGLVLAASGKAFVAGADVKFFVENLEKDAFEPIYHFARVGQDVYRTLSGKRQPSTARVQGLCLGGGTELALACDFVVCSPKAMFALPETGIGIVPGLGGTQRLPRRIGLPLAKWMIYTGEFVSAADAVEIGLADARAEFRELDATCASFSLRGRHPGRTAPSAAPSTKWQALWDFFAQHSVEQILSGTAPANGDKMVERAIKRIATKSPHALYAAEKLLNDGARMELDAGLDMELDALKVVFLHADALEGMKALLENRRPAFRQPAQV
ncbi:MAG: 3-hydroxyacyl-CoA dehydrogenase NAD-binding domain-containing protein [Planctomycetota bacterium]|nr:3-hydroxyacyl-CoA dehydrogenase NAD-binding domain-containing protein [Planctomycetota bacterium]